jgi:hypothetical protein
VSDPEVTVGRLLLLEYEGIKEEQRGRIGFRDNLLYTTLAAMAAVVAAVLQARGQPGLLLLLPPVCVVLGWTYLVNDEKVSAIGHYIRTDLGPRLTALAGDDEAVFGWETVHRSDTRRISRKAMQLAADIALFCGAPLIAVVVYWVQGHTSPLLLGISVAEAVVLILLAIQIVLYADLNSD